MADVVISYAPENEATARQLAEALTQLGYETWRPEAGSGASTTDAVTERIAGAKAVVVIWSRTAAASDWVRAEANIARGMKKLIQASADDHPPPVPFDGAQVASISTWLGEEDDAGWDAIRVGVAALAGTPVAAQAAPAPLPPAEPEPTPEPGRESLSDPAPTPQSGAAPAGAPAAPSAATHRRGPGLAIVMMILFVLIVLGGAGYFFWKRSQVPVAPAAAESNAAMPSVPAGPDLPQDVSIEPGGEVTPPPSNETFDRQAVLRGAAPAPVRSAPTAQGFEVGSIRPGEAFQTYQQSGDWWRVRTGSGVTGYLLASAIELREAGTAQPGSAPSQPQARPAERRAERRPPRQRIRKENAQVMEQYCAGAGSNTPQCRRFRNSVY